MGTPVRPTRGTLSLGITAQRVTVVQSEVTLQAVAVINAESAPMALRPLSESTAHSMTPRFHRAVVSESVCHLVTVSFRQTSTVLVESIAEFCGVMRARTTGMRFRTTARVLGPVLLG
jgi:hypothetical protein